MSSNHISFSSTFSRFPTLKVWHFQTPSKWNPSGCLKMCIHSSSSSRNEYKFSHQVALFSVFKVFKWTTFNAHLRLLHKTPLTQLKGDGLWQYRNVFHQILFKLVARLVYFDWKHLEVLIIVTVRYITCFKNARFSPHFWNVWRERRIELCRWR